jgi:hypothetical protein
MLAQMKKENIFYLIFILTMLAVRTDVFLFSMRKIIIGGMVIHHFWIGLMLVSLSWLFSPKYTILKAVLFPIGLGLLADELVYIFLGDRTVSDYWSLPSVLGAAAAAVIIFLLRKKISVKI